MLVKVILKQVTIFLNSFCKNNSIATANSALHYCHCHHKKSKLSILVNSVLAALHFHFIFEMNRIIILLSFITKLTIAESRLSRWTGEAK